jgi:Zn finger protein HypA/HybF involved in hydrogenase expression
MAADQEQPQSRVKYVVLRCLKCRWTFESCIIDGDKEACPECESEDTIIEREIRE